MSVISFQLKRKTQKDGFGATSAYSLAEYKVRSTSSFEKDYLLGKYGATPIIGEMEKIFNVWVG